MPSLILTGHPCTGKTTFATLLASRALLHPSNTISNIIHIRESTACPDQTKSECYSNSHMEKNTRAALKSEFDKAVIASGGGGGEKRGSTLVILDSLNYIKGYRYELYCISKAAGESHGTVWIMGDGSGGSSSDELAKKRNRQRKELQMNNKHPNQDTTTGMEKNEIDDGYFQDDEMMDSLVLRYEPPDAKNRWESPLYKVDVAAALPWGKDGTLLDDEKSETTLPTQMKAMEVKDDTQKKTVVSVSSAAPMTTTTKSAKKSSSGFKRRGKKSTQQPSSTQQQPPSSTTATTSFPIMTPTNIPSSIASRNLGTTTNNGTNNNTQEEHQGNNNGSNKQQKMEDVIDAILDSFLMNIAPLKEGMSTLKNVSAESNVLNQVDNLTQRINNEILKAQKQVACLAAGVGGKIFIPLSSSSAAGDDDGEKHRRAMTLSKPLYVNELRNCRRQFLKWIAGHPMPDGMRGEEMVEVYISYIESNI